MKRSNGGDVSSMDLLLDTICNTFGGIVFIALLLAVITQATPQVQKKETEIEKNETENQRLTEENNRLEGIINVLSNQLDRIYSSHEKATPSTVDTGTPDIRDFINQTESNLTKAVAIAKTLREKSDSLDTQIEDIKIQIGNFSIPKDITPKPTEKRRLPRVGKAPEHMNHTWVAIYRKHLYPLDIWIGDNSAMKIVKEPGGWICEPQPGFGQLISPGFENAGLMGKIIRDTSPESVVFQFMIDDVSFAEFNLIKRFLVGKGYRYMFNVQAPPYFMIQGKPTDTM